MGKRTSTVTVPSAGLTAAAPPQEAPAMPIKRGFTEEYVSRNTPMPQAAEQLQARTPRVIGGRVGLAAANASNRKTKRQQALEATNGWTTEDRTDIQDMPGFDF
ncbi:hypothetical protein G6011_04139 [Alternaria panax]|uniref:Uncharacterized protein n=1 Tax=Alternaria panax TaxID=48097 RepID=A0AAD4IGJ2_9PLEO|nr:hypothetical protein G6011_04139 [Alternaria panax]